MQNTIVHHEGAASLEAARTKIKLCALIIKIGLDIHARIYVAVAQYDQLLPKPARRLTPSEFVPWVEALLRAGHTVHVVYEACGFGFNLYRGLKALGAHCYVIAPAQERLISAKCGRSIIGSYFLISTVIGLSLSLTRITTVLDILSVALRPKCGVLGGV
jgi:hypothetical protein